MFNLGTFSNRQNKAN